MSLFERLSQINEVFFHASCPDGTASAAIIAKAFTLLGRPQPEFKSIQYDTDTMNTLVPRPGQLFVDITPPKHRWMEWLDANPIILDHHETTKDVVLGLNGIYGTNDQHSGAVLAFENVFMPISDHYHHGFSPQVIASWYQFSQIAMIRDTWKKYDPKWRDSGAQALALSLFESRTIIEKVQNHTFEFKELYDIGQQLLIASEYKVKLLVSTANIQYLTDGARTYKVGVFNCTSKETSDVANHLIEEGCDIGIGYFYSFQDEGERITISIRTTGNPSARKIAQVFGGGGHDQAAGFRIAMANTIPPSVIADYIEIGLKTIAANENVVEGTGE